MSNTFKRFGSLLLALMMVLSLLPVNAFATTDETATVATGNVAKIVKGDDVTEYATLQAAIDAAADRVAYAEAFVAELKEDKDKVHIINKMTDNNGDNNFVVSYNEFHESMYAAG